MNKVCGKRAKSDGKCVKDVDKFAFKLAKALCDGDAECQDGVKQDAADAKEAGKAAKQTAKDSCDDLEQQCLTECAAGEVFDDGLPAPL